ncbi:MAG: IS30 family transposase [Gammaproteobacteria bacterium CG22_combo_CG10-13_8_21_14_all_40_8]|nr:MAG: IS30 family transposase [Gammaproteobacteria bacterium CG22_combo_CG10-13_8_21_14_all_40_8]
MTYKHLNLEERHYIQISLKDKMNQTDIAKSLNRSQSSISREIARNKGQRGYRYQQADNRAKSRHQEKEKAIKLTPEKKAKIDHYLKEDWSPEQICGWFKKEAEIDLHHETIYRYILDDKQSGGVLYKHLRHQNKTYRKRYGSAHNRSSNGIRDRVDIEQRPAEANNRTRVGDWEGDTIIGKNHKGAIVTLDERVSKLRLAMPTGGKKADKVRDAIIKLFEPLKGFVLTLTLDNGKEFAYHSEVADKLDCATYFAKPYHSWERGQNENSNGLLRQYFPKSMELMDVTKQSVFEAVHKLNSRPRKCLGYKTPYEVFEELTGISKKDLAVMHL